MNKLLILISSLLLLIACQKDRFTDRQDALLITSVDSLHFDTVFTSTGSVSQIFKIINPNKEGLRISSVNLIGGSSSPFKINVDGFAGPQVNNLEVKGNDSIYVFVTVTINPNTSNLPFVIRDSIEILYNGNRERVQLDAYGQNANFLRNKRISGNEVWNNDLPYVILGGLTIDTNAVLTINKSSRIHLHADAPIIVQGTLKVIGEKWDSTKVVFSSDRLDEPYKDFPAGYPGIIFTSSSKNNEIDYAIIKNAYQAIVVSEPAPNGMTKLTLNETIIDNAYDIGILGINTSIIAKNLLVSNSGQNIVLVNGGDYLFEHATVVSYSNSFLQHRKPVLWVSNSLNENSQAFPLNAIFRNSIFWGESGGLVKNEVEVKKSSTTGTIPFNVTFEKVLWRNQTSPPATDAINNQDPQFDSINISRRYYDFRLKENSPAVNKGIPSGLPIDLDGNSRPRPAGSLPDLGAYERQ